MHTMGDLDDAVSVVDIWLQENPQAALWERGDDALGDTYRPSWERLESPLNRNPFLD